MGQNMPVKMGCSAVITNTVRHLLGMRISAQFWCKKRKISFLNYAEDVNTLARLKAMGADVLVVHHAMKIGKNILDQFTYGGLNIHPSRLPEYRGGSPFFWQVYDQVEYLSVSVHKATAQFDQGDILGMAEKPRILNTTEDQMSSAARSELAGPLIVEILDHFETRFNEATVQPIKTTTRYASYVNAHNLTSKIDIRQMSLEQLKQILNFTEEWRPNLLKTTGLKRLLVWRAVYCENTEFESPESGNETAQNNDLILKRDKLKFYAELPKGRIYFSPGFKLKAILSQIKGRQ